MKIRFSVIIPAYNEEKLLPRLLQSIEAARLNFQNGEVEIIVADNVSTDQTREIAEQFGCQVVKVEKRCIAAARNGGAKIANGEIFCFIDADSALHPDTFNKIDQAMNNPRFIVGATGVFLERRSFALWLIYWLILPMIWLMQMDTGVVFCRREDFEAVGGYNENLLLAEDVAFLKSLKTLGRQKGQRFIRLSSVKALGSTRKFDEHGDWHYFALLWQVSKNMARQGLNFFNKQEEMPEITEYWYKPKR
ncbi:MAG: glycosyltransferase [Pyrinomonadaceae bacterium]|nr:glycosyltransferase [Pyrinomonadaceae bacterium]